MRRVKRVLNFVKIATATEYSSDSDDQCEPQFSNLELRAQHNMKNRFNAVSIVNQNTQKSIIPRTPIYNHQSNLPNRRLKTSIQSTRECVLCLDQKSSADFSEPFSAKCSHHQRQICTECVREHVRITITDGSNTHVRCPEESCTAQFEFDVIQHLLVDLNPQETCQYKQAVHQFEDHLSKTCIEALPKFIWCAHGCGGGSQIISGDILTCDHYGKTTCVHHKIGWHTGITCVQYDLSLAASKNNMATDRWLRTNTKQCPKCSVKIEKNGGCDHMTCGSCRYEFCWVCLVDYNCIRLNGNTQHARHCTHYR